jgi:uncharacterized protein YdhG (YjbR/CyaY superfamily)
MASKKASHKSPEEGFTAEEKAAMKERAQEQKKAARRSSSNAKADGESDLLAKIKEMPEPERTMAERLHALISSIAPELMPRTWYGMPAYAKAGEVICFFQSAAKFKTRYATLGFSDKATLDADEMWPTAFAITELTEEVESRIRELIKKAVAN